MSIQNKIEVSDEAENDFDESYQYYAQKSDAPADRFLNHTTKKNALESAFLNLVLLFQSNSKLVADLK